MLAEHAVTALLTLLVTTVKAQQVYTITQWPSICSAIYTSGSQSVTLVQSTTTIAAAAASSSTPLSDQAANNGAPFVLQINQPTAYGSKRQAARFWLMPNGNSTADGTLAAQFYINSGQLRLLTGGYYSTSAGVVNQPFAASSQLGSINTIFTILAGQLRWYNQAFANDGYALFYKIPAAAIANAQIIASFSSTGQNTPASWAPVYLSIQDPTAAVPGSYSNSQAVSVVTSIIFPGISSSIGAYSSVAPAFTFAPTTESSSNSAAEPSSSNTVSTVPTMPPISMSGIAPYNPSSSSATGLPSSLQSLTTITAPGTPIGPYRPTLLSTDTNTLSTSLSGVTTSSLLSVSGIVPYSLPSSSDSGLPSSLQSLTTITALDTPIGPNRPTQVSMSTYSLSTSSSGASMSSPVSMSGIIPYSSPSTSTTGLPTSSATSTAGIIPYSSSSSSTTGLLASLESLSTVTVLGTPIAPHQPTQIFTSANTVPTISSGPVQQTQYSTSVVVSASSLLSSSSLSTLTSSSQSVYLTTSPSSLTSSVTSLLQVQSSISSVASSSSIPISSTSAIQQYSSISASIATSASSSTSIVNQSTSSASSAAQRLSSTQIASSTSSTAVVSSPSSAQDQATNQALSSASTSSIAMVFSPSSTQSTATIQALSSSTPPSLASSSIALTTSIIVSSSIPVAYTSVPTSQASLSSNTARTTTTTSTPSISSTSYSTTTSTLASSSTLSSSTTSTLPSSSTSYSTTTSTLPSSSTPYSTTASAPLSSSVSSKTTSSSSSSSAYLVLASPTPCNFGDPAGTDEDDSYCEIDLPFSMTMYSVTAPQTFASTNGFISMINGSSQYQANPLPFSGIPNTTVLPLFDDLYIYGSASPAQGIFYQTSSTAVTYEYYLGRANAPTAINHFTVGYSVATPGIFTYTYYNVGNGYNGNTSCVGSQGQNSAGTEIASQYSYQTAIIFPNSVIVCNTLANSCQRTQ